LFLFLFSQMKKKSRPRELLNDYDTRRTKVSRRGKEYDPKQDMSFAQSTFLVFKSFFLVLVCISHLFYPPEMFYDCIEYNGGACSLGTLILYVRNCHRYYDDGTPDFWRKLVLDELQTFFTYDSRKDKVRIGDLRAFIDGHEEGGSKDLAYSTSDAAMRESSLNMSNINANALSNTGRSRRQAAIQAAAATHQFVSGQSLDDGESPPQAASNRNRRPPASSAVAVLNNNNSNAEKEPAALVGVREAIIRAMKRSRRAMSVDQLVDAGLKHGSESERLYRRKVEMVLTDPKNPFRRLDGNMFKLVRVPVQNATASSVLERESGGEDTDEDAKSKRSNRNSSQSSRSRSPACPICGKVSLRGSNTIHWIQCDSCSKWVHAECDDVDVDAMGEDDRYFCPSCRSRQGGGRS
jgi:hypothetical protein